MTTPTGQIKFSDITSEFGTPPDKKLGSFRVSHSIAGRTWPLDTGVPTSGQIKFSDLKNKTCNVVVDYSGSEILCDGSSSEFVTTNVTHTFDDVANVSVSGPTSSRAGVTVTVNNPTDEYIPPAENNNFTVARNSSTSYIITLTPQVVTGYSNVTFSYTAGNTGTETQSKSIVPMVAYAVTASGGATLSIFANPGSPDNIGTKLLLQKDTPSELTVEVSSGFSGYFYSVDGNFYFIVPTPVNADTSSRKHYTITFTDNSTTIPDTDPNVTNISVLANIITIPGSNPADVGQLTASGLVREMLVTKKERVSANSFKVWFYGSVDLRSPTAKVGNYFCRDFNIQHAVTSNSSGGLGDAKSVYTSSGIVVGGFKGIPGVTTKKVHHVIRRSIGAGFRTGTWDTNTKALNFIVTSSGEIIGRGGNGATGSGGRGYGNTNVSPLGSQRGEDGSPAMYAQWPSTITIETGGRLQGGGGGGGGGGSACCDPDNNPADPVTSGGGGGGGAGFPAGVGGGTSGSAKVSSSASNGNSGSRCSGGGGRVGAGTSGNQSPRNCAGGGGGGGGGGPTPGQGGSFGPYGCGSHPGTGITGNSSTGGSGGSGAACNRRGGWSQGGSGGNNGFAIAYGSGIVVNVTNSGGVYFGGTGVG